MAEPVVNGRGPFSRISRASLRSFGKSLLLAALVFLAVKTWLRSSSGPELNQRATPFQLPVAGSANTRSLGDFQGAPLLVEAVASWCGACRESASAMREAALAKREHPIRFLDVVVDSSGVDAANLSSAWHIPYDVLTDDGSFAAAYKISLLPTFILIDETGVVKVVHNGRADRDDIEGWLAQVGANARL